MVSYQSADRSQPAPLEIAHVLFMDIVAYSRLPMEEQTRLLGLLQKIVRDTADVSRAVKRRQLLLLPTGDGMALVFFGDPEAPARCALEISRVLKDHADLSLRMGLHTGPVQRVQDINANRNVSGGGINTAQRVMDCGDAGHILVSKSVADVLGHMSSWNEKLHDMGEAEVKHGVRLQLFNMYTEKAGNPALPEKLRTVRKAVIRKKRRKVSFVAIAAGMVTAFVIVGGFLYTRRAHALTEKDTIVLADFVNKTADPIFDDTLKQGLSVSLSQSPFINLLSDEKVNNSLKMMGRVSGERLTPDLARQVCLRTNNKASLEGSISSLGGQYIIGLKAIHCVDGDIIAQEQVQASAKEEVLKALDKAASELRGKLGESLHSIKQFETPVAEATTPSLEALKAFSLGQRTTAQKGDADALPYFERSIELDPNFAMGYAALGGVYVNTGQAELASHNIKKAFDLRERVSEPERFMISAAYYSLVKGDLEKARYTCELWEQTYPRSELPHSFLGAFYGQTGRWEKAVNETKESLLLGPDNVFNYINLGEQFLALNRPNDAQAIFNRAEALKLDHVGLHLFRYYLAFVRSDTAEMQMQLTWGMGRPGYEDPLLSAQSDTEAFHGRLRMAREFSRRAVDSAGRAGERETSATWQANAALREAEFGNSAGARQAAIAALGIAAGRDVKVLAALALARAHDELSSRRLSEELAHDYPDNTILTSYWIPAIRAAMEMNNNNATKAVELLQDAATYDLGAPYPFQLGTLYPAYLRGEAYLETKNGKAAVLEFTKVLKRPGLVMNFSTGALARLQLGRAKALTSDKAGARDAYESFLTLWKDADPDIPILKQAKAEYAKLQ